jgi:hypothetical protein
VEAAWEIVENSPVIIDRYREATIAIGYRGDTILNSVSDILLMIAGFLVGGAFRFGPAPRSCWCWSWSHWQSSATI